MLTEQITKKPSQNCVICLKVGSLYSANYVNNLYYAIRKFTNDDFICFTDDASGIDDGIICYDMFTREHPNWRHLWCKIIMYGRDEIKKYNKKIFFDLDLVIQGDINPILNHECDWALIKSVWKGIKFRIDNPKEPIFNSSVMVWKDNTWIYDLWEKSWERIVESYIGNDKWYWNENIKPTYLPNLFYSYREGSKPEHYWENNWQPYMKYQPGFSVCLFHQKPDIHELDPEEHLVKIWNGTL
jgi:hypothetical protein